MEGYVFHCTGVGLSARAGGGVPPSPVTDSVLSSVPFPAPGVHPDTTGVIPSLWTGQGEGYPLDMPLEPVPGPASDKGEP